MDPLSVLSRPARPPDLVIAYGAGTDHVADVHLPPADGRKDAGSRSGRPLVIFLHGGFWRAQFGRGHTAPLAEALAAAGFIVCAPEYRRTGQPGGGWPGTFDDVAAAVERLPGLIATAAGVRPGAAPVLAGHSAGGHLALWAASRQRLPVDSPWHSPSPRARGIVALAAVSDLAACYDQRLGHGAAGALLGGGPRRFPGRYAAADPARLLPAAAPVRMVHGSSDDQVPVEMSLSYAARAQAAGATASCDVLPGAGHFEVIDPLSGVWPRVIAAFRAAAGQP